LKLGLASLLNDTASEMIYPLLPHFLLTVLLGNRFHLGVIEGAADGWTERPALVLWGVGVAVPALRLGRGPAPDERHHRLRRLTQGGKARDDAIVKNALAGGEPVVIVVLGGGHDLAESVRAADPHCGYIRVTTDKVAELMGR
jgi:hypothetical protein